MGGSDLVQLLSRVESLGILASKRFGELARQLRDVLGSRGCGVVAAVEGSTEVAAGLPDYVQAVLVLGDSPADPQAFSREGELGAATSLVFTGLASGAPVRALGDRGGPEEAAAVIEELREWPKPVAGDVEERWDQAAAAAIADDAEGLEDSLDLWPELLVRRDGAGNTLLHCAASAGAPQAAAMLLARGADVCIRNKEELPAGDVAFRAGKQAVFEVLVMHRVSCLARERDAEEPPGPPRKRRRESQHLVAPGHYLNQELRYEEGRLLDADSKAVMMGWEAPLMERHAELLLPRAGLRVANVGFGLGLVDGFIAKLRPSQHHIIEAHKDVQAAMRARGWHERAGVVVHDGRWQEVIEHLEPHSLDAVFFDTWSETYEDLQLFVSELDRLLAPGATFSFFNGMAPYSITEHAAFCRLAQEDLRDMGLQCDICKVELGELGDDTWRGVRERYWQFDSYYLPLARKPRENGEAPELPKALDWRRWPEFPVRVTDKLGTARPRADFGLSA